MSEYRIVSDASGPLLWIERTSSGSSIETYVVENGNSLGASQADDWDIALQELQKWEAFQGKGRLHIPTLGHGEFHPRIDRFSRDAGDYASRYRQHHARERQATHLAALLLFERLANLLEVIEPVEANSKTFGHLNRQLLILACTEVEAAWRGILKANGYSSSKNRFTTNDYVKLLAPMRLSEWEVKLTHGSGWPAMQPFRNWSAVSPTESLDWYNAYNLVKHDREDQLPRASLENVLNAMAAVAIMAWASFGELVVCKESVPLAALLEPTRRPSWAPEEVYYGPRPGPTTPQWTPVNLRF